MMVASAIHKKWYFPILFGIQDRWSLVVSKVDVISTVLVPGLRDTESAFVSAYRVFLHKCC